MKKVIQFFAIVSLVGGVFLFAGCQKDGFNRNVNKAVEFGARANNGLGTRTAYGDYDNADSPTHQDIKWVSGDVIRIYSPSSVRRVAFEQGASLDQCYYWADYDVYPQDDPTLGRLMNAGDGNYINSSKEKGEVGNGLIWITETSSFFGVYPTPDTYESTGTGLDGVEGKFSLSIPEEQAFSEKGNMSYAHMVAAVEDAAIGTNPILEFNPAYTAFEISVRSASEAIALKKFELISDANPIAGDYVVQMVAASNTFTSTTSSSKKTITVDLTNRSAPASDAANPLVFTVFALPKDVNNLSIRFTLANDVQRTLALKNNGSTITFTGGSKHRIYGLFLPNGEILINVGTAPWVDNGDDFSYVTIENVTTRFTSYQRYNDDHNYGSGSWNVPNYVAVAFGRSTTERVDPDDPTSALTNIPIYSSMLELETINVGTELELRSDNPKIGFVTAVNDIWGEPSTTITIPESDDINDVNQVKYFVVPVSADAVGEVANISLVRTDYNVPIAYTHSDMPGSTDHTLVPFKVVTPEDYTTNTNQELPSI